MRSTNHRASPWQRLGSVVIAGCLLASGSLRAEAPGAMPATEERMEPKFVWGILLNLVANYAMSTLSSWLLHKLTDQADLPAKLDQLQNNSLTAAILPLVRFALGVKSAGAVENTTAAGPAQPFSLKEGRPNYQGLNITVLGFAGDGQFQGVRPLSAKFTNGDRIKLKVLPTFDGLLVVENINPQGLQRQIYPPRADAVVALKEGVEVLIPLGKDEYFQFAGVSGEEQLLVTIRDPRSLQGGASPAPASREETANGTNFVQETPPGTYPVISQSLRIQHGP